MPQDNLDLKPIAITIIPVLLPLRLSLNQCLTVVALGKAFAQIPNFVITICKLV